MRRTIVAATAALAALLVPLAGAAGAGAPLPDFDYTPTSGPAGTVITASGDCSIFLSAAGAPESLGDEPDSPAGIIASVEVQLSGPGGALASTTEEVNTDGTWEAQLTVPDGTEPGDYDLDAACIFGGVLPEGGRGLSAAAVDAPAGNGFIGVYATQIFTVTAPATTTTAAPTSSTAAPTSTTRPAAAAQAVRAAPSFTG